MAPMSRVTVLTLSIVLASTGAIESSSLRSGAALQAQVEKAMEKAKTSVAMVSKSSSTLKVASTAKAKQAAKAGTTTKGNATAAQPAHMDMVNEMRAEMCAHQHFGVSDEYDECLKFMTGACNPGPDMLMNGSPGEVTTGKGFCTDFFLNYQAHQPGGNAAVAPVSGGESGESSVAPMSGGESGESFSASGGGATLPDDTTEEVAYPESGDRVVAGTEEMEDVMEEVGELMKSRSSSADEMKEDLAALNWYEDELQAKIDGLDEDEYCRQVEKESVLVGQETSAPEMADMLSDMRCEMHRYSVPFYTKLLQKKIGEVRNEQKELVLKIEARKQENRTRAVEGATPKAESKAEKKEPKVEAASEKTQGRQPAHWFEWLLVICSVSACIAGCFFFGKSQSESA